ncbi:MAG: triose-phosphate isomerase [Patescibacteria group bacterium]
MSKKKIIIGNWKMNPLTLKEGEKLFADISKQVKIFKKTELVICPPYLYLEKLKKISKKINLGAQNGYPGDVGASTGEVSLGMLNTLGVKYVILGHSERRMLGEVNADINKKIKSTLFYKMTPILCVGESTRDENHEYLNFIKTQIEECLQGLTKISLSQVVIAYEPVWAIGKDATRVATPAEFLEISIFIKKILSDKFGKLATEDLRIIYGGSVHPENALSFLVEGKAEGFLPGRDSLNVKKFLEIIKITENTK